METILKYHVNHNNEIARKFTIKEIFAENWDAFIEEMTNQGKPIRETIMREVEKIIGCQEPRNGFRLVHLPQM